MISPKSTKTNHITHVNSKTVVTSISKTMYQYVIMNALMLETNSLLLLRYAIFARQRDNQ